MQCTGYKAKAPHTLVTHQLQLVRDVCDPLLAAAGWLHILVGAWDWDGEIVEVGAAGELRPMAMGIS